MKLGEGLFDFEVNGEPTQDDLRTVVVLLFVMAATHDGVFLPEELQKICGIMSRHFGQSPAETAQMIEVGNYCLTKSGTAERLLERVRDRFTASQKERLVSLVKDVVASDSFLSSEEEGFMRSIGTYLGQG